MKKEIVFIFGIAIGAISHISPAFSMTCAKPKTESIKPVDQQNSTAITVNAPLPSDRVMRAYNKLDEALTTPMVHYPEYSQPFHFDPNAKVLPILILSATSSMNQEIKPWHDTSSTSTQLKSNTNSATFSLDEETTSKLKLTLSPNSELSVALEGLKPNGSRSVQNERIPNTKRPKLPTKRYIAQQIVLKFLTHFKQLQIKGVGGEGIRAFACSSGRAYALDNLQSGNFDETWKKIRWDYEAMITTGWEVFTDAYAETFGGRDGELPVKSVLIITDSVASDLDKFAEIIKADDKAYVTFVVLGNTEDLDQTFQSYLNIYKENKERVRVVPVDTYSNREQIAKHLVTFIR